MQAPSGDASAPRRHAGSMEQGGRVACGAFQDEVITQWTSRQGWAISRIASTSPTAVGFKHMFDGGPVDPVRFGCAARLRGRCRDAGQGRSVPRLRGRCLRASEIHRLHRRSRAAPDRWRRAADADEGLIELASGAFVQSFIEARRKLRLWARDSASSCNCAIRSEIRSAEHSGFALV